MYEFKQLKGMMDERKTGNRYSKQTVAKRSDDNMTVWQYGNMTQWAKGDKKRNNMKEGVKMWVQKIFAEGKIDKQID